MPMDISGYALDILFDGHLKRFDGRVCYGISRYGPFVQVVDLVLSKERLSCCEKTGILRYIDVINQYITV